MLNPPYTELGVLLRAVRGADWLAATGYPVAGYRLLSEHWRRAKEAAREGCPWAREFIAAYGLALAEYSRGMSSHPRR